MSPATKSKSKDKKTGKEAQKASPKTASSVNGNSSMPASAYNPLLGTFQVLDSVSVASVSPLHYGRFRSIDEADVNGIESDSVSNNGSCSGESEDHKEKTTNLPLKQEVIPGADNDKREKIRQKNERKHQRQKERRAQELHEKCSTYLMSRKLEALTQQLVAMGISQERATTALMMNEGKVEESVHWLFDRGEEEIEKQCVQTPGNLKIDITEELARITHMELLLKCTRQEIERAVVQAEGDLDRAEEVMKGTKYEDSSVPVKQEESVDPLTASNGKLKVGVGYQNSDAERPETQPVLLPGLQPTRDDKSFNYTKSPSTALPMNKMAQPMKRPQPKLDWPKPHQAAALADKRWPNTGQVPSASYPLPSSSPQPSVRIEARYVASGNEFKNPQQQQQQPVVNREPVVAMKQRPQVVSTNPVPTLSPSASPTSWHPAASVEIMKSNGFIQQTHSIPSARSPNPNSMNPNQIYQQLQYQHHRRFSNNNNQLDPHGSIPQGNGGLWNRNTPSSPSISAASSLGLFSAISSAGTSGASSPIDWSSGGSVDYTSIDWSLDQGLYQNTKLNGLWSESKSGSHMCDSGMNRFSLKGSMGGRVNNSSNFVSMENAGVGIVAETQAATSQDWTSPFEGKDIFSLSRQYVSPSL